MKIWHLALMLVGILGCESQNADPSETPKDTGALSLDGASDSPADASPVTDASPELSVPADTSADMGSPDTDGRRRSDVSGAQTYACGWPKNDPGTLVATGTSVGDVVADWGAQDQCGERYRVWDGYGRYMLLISPVFW